MYVAVKIPLYQLKVYRGVAGIYTIKHPEGGHKSDRNVDVKNKNVHLNILVIVHLVVSARCETHKVLFEWSVLILTAYKVVLPRNNRNVTPTNCNPSKIQSKRVRTCCCLLPFRLCAFL